MMSLLPSLSFICFQTMNEQKCDALTEGCLSPALPSLALRCSCQPHHRTSVRRLRGLFASAVEQVCISHPRMIVLRFPRAPTRQRHSRLPNAVAQPIPIPRQHKIRSRQHKIRSRHLHGFRAWKYDAKKAVPDKFDKNRIGGKSKKSF
jgi:hypothetical protein